ncbi:tetratricopeptide repeat protein [Roseateles sp.]|jgi:protein O-GlcNAc transferase|uniref:O-linked N-acetylglucosamine transferase, SPINDLY family protein n=1 Tax=Roseateles sp. TaxID=1971397 RepID=UPI0037C6E1D8
MSADPQALFVQAGAYLEQGQLQQAERLYRQVLQHQPRHAEALHMLGAVALQSGHAKQALEFIDAAIAIGATAGMHFNAGIACQAVGELDQGLAHMLRAAELAPDWADALNNAGVGLMECGRAEEALVFFERAMRQDPANREASSNYLMTTLYQPGASQRWIADRHFEVGQRYALNSGDASRPVASLARSNTARFRVGFVSGDLRMHPVGLMLKRLLKPLAKCEVDLFLYSNNSRDDELTAELASGGTTWRPVRCMSDRQAADLIRSDSVDVLVDLSGHTAHNRLGVFALRPAPVQVSWLGYGATTGLPMMDYVLVDPYCAEAADQEFYSERLAFLPATRLLFPPPAHSPDLTPPPSAQAGCVTFGCFNNVVKLNADVARAWAEILRALPSARLLLKGRQYHHGSCQRYVAQLLAEAGVDLARVLIEGYHSYADYLQAFARVDIALDPFPFPGGATSLDGLWMGVPVLTQRGKGMIARQGESFLKNVGLDNWIATDTLDYVAKAVAYAKQPETLVALRSTLRERLASSPLCRAETFAADLANLLRGLGRSA